MTMESGINSLGTDQVGATHDARFPSNIQSHQTQSIAFRGVNPDLATVCAAYTTIFFANYCRV